MNDKQSIIDDLKNEVNEARMFSAETKLERRITNIFLACLRILPAYSNRIFDTVGKNVGTRSKIRTFTEPKFKALSNKEDKDRPDGLIVISLGKSEWSALVEVKVGNSVLSEEQLLRYFDIARAKKVDAFITISNQFVTNPSFSPIKFKNKKDLKGIELYHWSWKFLRTEARLIKQENENNKVDDNEAKILTEMIHFFDHKTSNISGFNYMGDKWSTVIKLAGKKQLPEKISNAGINEKDVVERWLQERKDLCLILSEKTGKQAELYTRGVSDQNKQFENELELMLKEKKLRAELKTATKISIFVEVCLERQMAKYSINVPAPKIKGAQNRLKWLLDQIPEGQDEQSKKRYENIDIECVIKGRNPTKRLKYFRDNRKNYTKEFCDTEQSSFKVFLSSELGGNFTNPKNFIRELEQDFEFFYDAVVRNIKPIKPISHK